MCIVQSCLVQHQKRFWSLLIILFLISCSHTRNGFVEKPLKKIKIGANFSEVKLGNSNFYLKVPDGFEVVEAKGKEGQHGFHISPNKSSSKMFGFIEIQHGQPITYNKSENLGNPVEYVKSNFLDMEIKWTIYRSNSGYFDAETPSIRGVSASALSNKRSDIDILISIIQTLNEK